MFNPCSWTYQRWKSVPFYSTDLLILVVNPQLKVYNLFLQRAMCVFCEDAGFLAHQFLSQESGVLFQEKLFFFEFILHHFQELSIQFHILNVLTWQPFVDFLQVLDLPVYRAFELVDLASDLTDNLLHLLFRPTDFLRHICSKLKIFIHRPTRARIVSQKVKRLFQFLNLFLNIFYGLRV